MGISFSEPERLKEIFDSQTREEWQKTSHIMQTLDLQAGEIIADVGAGTGYFSNIFAQRLPDGKVYAIDCEPNMIAYMDKRFNEAQQTNIHTILSQPTDPCIPAEVNTVFLANTYRFIQHRQAFLQHIFEQTEANTRYVFVDFKGANARVSPQMAIDEIQDAGFSVVDFDTNGCPDHYILTFKKANFK